MALKIAAAVLLTGFVLVQAQNVATFSFLSRPDIIAPVLHVMNYDSSLVAPGYLFFTPNSPGKTNFSAGPYIYNNDGYPIWSGYKDLPTGMGAFNAQVCPYQGSPHLCFTQFQGPQGGGQGAVGSMTHIYDNTYTSVRNIMPSGTWRNLTLTQDLHEFNMIGSDGGSALMTSYITVAQNNTFPACANSPTTSFIKSGLFSEVATDGTNKELFQWSALDHLDPAETIVCPGQPNVGAGKVETDGFDFFHINSVDKDGNGDYLVSGRHTSTLYKIAGLKNPDGLSPGSVVWKLGGKNSSFPTMNSKVPMAPNLNFSYQHHARWNTAINGVTVWDNANNAMNATSQASSGKSISITNDSATLIGIYISPDRQLDSSQGSHQVLPNGNHFQGLGSYPFMYEETNNGKLAFYARFGILPLQSYRAFRFEWTAQPPITEMAMFGYSQHCNGTAAYYASWNGATQVATWTFFGSTSQSGTFVKAASASKGGAFETFAPGAFKPFAYAVAYDSTGKELGRTSVVKTFVPNVALAPTCNTMSCPQGTNYTSTSLQTVCATNSSASPAKLVKRALLPLSASSSLRKHHATKSVTRRPRPVETSSIAVHNKRVVTKTRTKHATKTSVAHEPQTTTSGLHRPQTSSVVAIHKRVVTKTRTKHATKTSAAHKPLTSSSALHKPQSISSVAPNRKRAVTKTRTGHHVTKSSVVHQPQTTSLPGHRVKKPSVTKTKTRKGPKATTTVARGM